MRKAGSGRVCTLAAVFGIERKTWLLIRWSEPVTGHRVELPLCDLKVID